MDSERDKSERRARAVAWLVGLAVALPVLVHHYPPMYDLPYHEEIVATLRSMGDERRFPPGLHAWNLGHPNQLFYFLAWPLAYAVGPTWACKIVVAASALALPPSMVRLARWAGVTAWVAPLSAAVAYGFSFRWGFVGHLLALPLTVLFTPWLDRCAERATARATLAACALLTTLYLAHEGALVVGCGTALVFAAAYPAGLRATAMRLAPVGFGVALAGAQLVYNARVMPPSLTRAETMKLPLWQLLEYLPQTLVGPYDDTTQRIVFWASSAALSLLVGRRLVAGSRAWRGDLPWGRAARLPLGALAARFPWRPSRPGLSGWVHLARVDLLAGGLLLAYFVVPFAANGAVWIHGRFLGPAFLMLLVALAPRDPPPLAARGFVVAVAALVVAIAQPHFRDSSVIHRDFESLLPHVAPGSAIATIDAGRGYKRPTVAIEGVVARSVGFRGGRVAYSFVSASSIPPVRYAPGHAWNDPMLRLLAEQMWVVPPWDLRRFRYLVVWIPADVTADIFERALRPEARLVARAGRWVLFESNLAVVPITAPDEPLRGEAEPLWDRLKRASDEVQARAPGSR